MNIKRFRILFLIFAAALSQTVKAYADNTQTTSSGHVFVRDTSIPQFGEEAWRDEYGAIWSDILLQVDHKPELSWQSSNEFCMSFGAHVPSKEDYERLVGYMTTNGEYKPQILPNLLEPVWTRSSYETVWKGHPTRHIFYFAAQFFDTTVNISGYATRCVFYVKKPF